MCWYMWAKGALQISERVWALLWGKYPGFRDCHVRRIWPLFLTLKMEKGDIESEDEVSLWTPEEVSKERDSPRSLQKGSHPRWHLDVCPERTMPGFWRPEPQDKKLLLFKATKLVCLQQFVTAALETQEFLILFRVKPWGLTIAWP